MRVRVSPALLPQPLRNSTPAGGSYAARGREKVTFFYAMPLTVAAGLLASGHFGWLGGVVAAVLAAAAFASIEERQAAPSQRANGREFSTERPVS
jgi:hypothetical protein